MSMEPDDADLAGPKAESGVDDLTEQENEGNSLITDTQSRHNAQGVYRFE